MALGDGCIEDKLAALILYVTDVYMGSESDRWSKTSSISKAIPIAIVKEHSTTRSC